jgi:hypothetical protein
VKIDIYEARDENILTAVNTQILHALAHYSGTTGVGGKCLWPPRSIIMKNGDELIPQGRVEVSFSPDRIRWERKVDVESSGYVAHEQVVQKIEAPLEEIDTLHFG